MNAMTSFVQAEPLRVQALAAALVVLAGAFGLHLTGEQVGALTVVVVIVSGEIARLHVTPTSKVPQSPQG
jgi:hypothetical protein